MTPLLSRRGSVAVGLILAVAASAPALAAPSSAAPSPAAPAGVSGSSSLLSSVLRGADAATVGRIARTNGLTTAAVQRLAADPTSHVDATGRLYVVEPRVPSSPPQAATPAAVPAVTTDALTLHSRPGSKRTIYLDFTGQTLTGTAWNDTQLVPSVTIKPYDTDDDPSTFGPEEQAVITSVWQRVSEDYASMNVDVTTQEPAPGRITRSGSTDQTYGTRLLISPDDFIFSSCGCGGIAYVGVFDLASQHDYYQPALVFLKGVGNDAKNLAEAASYEIGHNLGLSHDGTSSLGYYTGQGAWAPIMGVGYFKPVAQWSRGEYADANNLEDDFAVMASHGTARAKDDHGSTRAKATLFTGNATGVVGSGGDLDVFRVDHPGGVLAATATPALVAPDLDIRLTLSTSRGVVIATDQPASFLVDRDVAGNLGASISTPLTAGTYYVTVQGSGQDDPQTTGYSSYGSVGAYTLSNAAPAVSRR